MSYYPIFPEVPTYLHPALNPHIHAELTAIRHGHLIRQQAQLEYLSRTNFQLQQLDRVAKYSNQVLEKQFRIAKMLEEDRARLLLERQMLEQRNIQQQIRFREQMRRLDIQRQYMLANDRAYLTERKREIKNEQMRQTLKDPLSEANKETAKFNTVKGEEILNFELKDYRVPHIKQIQLPQYKGEVSTKRKRVQSVVKDITYDEGQSYLQSSNTKRISSILKKSQYKSPKQNKSKKQVQFLNQSSSKKGNSQTESLSDTKNDSYCLHNSALRAAYKQNRKKAPNSDQASTIASKMIKNRLKVSSVVYRDSQFRNIKHQMQHLANTYDTECRLRRDLKVKISSRDDIIKKYNIMPPESI